MEKELVTSSEAKVEVAESNLANAETSGKKTFERRKGPRPTIPGFEDRLIAVKRINKTTKGGRRMRFSALVIIGNKKGEVGYGIGKSVETPVAIRKAAQDAKKNIIKVLMNKKKTLYHEITCSQGATRILLKPAPTGTGIIAGGPIRAVLELAGFTDVCSKNLGSNAAINMVQTTFKCLKLQRHPSEIAKLRGKDRKDL